MGGKAFKNTTPITLFNLNLIWQKLIDDLRQLNCHNIQSVGSTFNKELMGDIDIAVNGDYQVIYDSCIKEFKKENVRKIGSNLVSISYPYINSQRVQVDILIGNVNFLKWTHHAPHWHESKFKPILRQLFFNSIIQLITEKSLKECSLEENEEYQLDIQRGLFKIKKEKIGIKGNSLKTPKIIKRSFISDDPSYIMNWITTKSSIQQYYQFSLPFSFENIVEFAIENLTFDDLNFVKSNFIKRILECNKKSPNRLASTQEEIDIMISNILNYLGNHNVIK